MQLFAPADNKPAVGMIPDGVVGGLNGNDISSILVSKYDSINSRSSLDFFNRLRENDPLFDKLHLILGGDGYHCSEMVKSAAH